MVTKYGRPFPARVDDLTLEAIAFRDGFSVESGGLGKSEHFRRFADALWGLKQKSAKTFIWHPWALDMLDACCNHQYVTFAGCGSSGKTDFMALWGIVSYLVSPHNTLVLATSTSLKEARKRIWGSICDYWQAHPPGTFPGKLVNSMGMIRYADGEGENPYSDRVGICLLASEKSREREAIGKLIGIKQVNVILLADELAELSEAVLQAALTNLTLNPHFQMVGASNPKSYYDPFGKLAEPKRGWSSISVEDTEWETTRGICLHFDALKSPNWITQSNDWPIIGYEKIKDALATMDMNSLGFWRMFRGFWSPSGDEQAVYSEVDLIKFRATEKAVWGVDELVKVAALDPAFTNGGDRSAVWFAQFGRDRDGRMVIQFEEPLVLEEDVTNREEPRNFQIARKFKDECVQRGIPPQNACYDGTGAGIVFGDVVSVVWSPRVLSVSFGGSPSDRTLPDGKLAKDVYANRVTEIWFGGYAFLRSNQIRGVTPDLAKEWCARRYTTAKAGMELKMCVEPKEDMKLRTQQSPDLGDAAMLIIWLLMERFGAVAGGASLGGRSGAYGSKQFTWGEAIRQMQPSLPRLMTPKGLASKRLSVYSP